jgi:hypothetical protein
MYRGFELDIKEWRIDSINETMGWEIHERYKNITKSFFKQAENNGVVIDAEKIKNEWFPKIDADIFISHSHTDEKLAKKLAGWLFSNFGIKAFIDSTVWKYSNDLLKSIDDVHSMNEDKKTYNYNLRNNSTTHIHLMLNSALMQMIDHCEVFFLLKTDNSITTVDTIKDPITFSPWIYSEIITSSLIRKRELSDYRYEELKRKMNSIELKMTNESLQIAYTPDRDHLTKLSKIDMEKWLSKHKEVQLTKPIGHLYHMKPMKSKHEIING